MIRENYSLVSVMDEEGEINHHYSGRVNRNANEYEPIMDDFSQEKDGLNHTSIRIERLHEEIVLRKGVKRIETKIIGKRIGRNLFLRSLDRLSYLLEVQ
tara:strand:+ start:997 stop:1293 length:297 start_codon:yes stop_codon:yes gene_type:complete